MRRLTLRSRIAATVGLVAVVALVVVGTGTAISSRQSIRASAVAHAEEKVAMFAEALTRPSSGLATLVGAYSRRTSVAEFLSGDRDDPPSSISDVDLFTEQRLVALVLADLDGVPVLSRYGPGGPGEGIPSSLDAVIRDGDLLTGSVDDTRVAIAVVGGQPLQVVARAVTAAGGSGPVRGHVVFAVHLGDRLEELRPLVDGELTLGPPQPAASRPLGEGRAWAAMPIVASDGTVLASLEVVSSLGEEVWSPAIVWRSALSLGLVVVVLVLVTGVVVERVAVRPITRLGWEVAAVAVHQDPSRRISAGPAPPEVTDLEERINELLSSLESSNADLERASRELALLGSIEEDAARLVREVLDPPLEVAQDLARSLTGLANDLDSTQRRRLSHRVDVTLGRIRDLLVDLHLVASAEGGETLVLPLRGLLDDADLPWRVELDGPTDLDVRVDPLPTTHLLRRLLTATSIAGSFVPHVLHVQTAGDTVVLGVPVPWAPSRVADGAGVQGLTRVVPDLSLELVVVERLAGRLGLQVDLVVADGGPTVEVRFPRGVPSTHAPG